jgi:rare lipoprotein A
MLRRGRRAAKIEFGAKHLAEARHMRNSSGFNAIIAMLAVTGLLAGCAQRQAKLEPKAPEVVVTKPGGIYKVGNPYQIGGNWYYPQVDYDYAETGLASWYGPGFHGKKTANGETYDQHDMTAAHRTLPMPSIVQVTNLENGHSIKVRINDRGPYAKNRIIDLSFQAATLLGFVPQGTAKVRVEILPEASRRVAALAQSRDPTNIVPAAAPLQSVTAEPLAPIGNPAGDSLNDAAAPAVSSEALEPGSQLAALPLEPLEAALPESPTPDLTVDLQTPQIADLYIQAGAFLRVHNANRLKVRLSSLGRVDIAQGLVGEDLYYRVRIGPLASVEEADRMLDRLYANGINDARVIVD